MNLLAKVAREMTIIANHKAMNPRPNRMHAYMNEFQIDANCKLYFDSITPWIS
jgi:hypothetical protein